MYNAGIFAGWLPSNAALCLRKANWLTKNLSFLHKKNGLNHIRNSARPLCFLSFSNTLEGNTYALERPIN